MNFSFKGKEEKGDGEMYSFSFKPTQVVSYLVTC